jgi:long-chain acyl-CoA synthetase
VVGKADELLGEAIWAYVVITGPLSRKELLAHCRTHLPNYMIPPHFVFCQQLPKNESGKVQKLALRDAAFDQA